MIQNSFCFQINKQIHNSSLFQMNALKGTINLYSIIQDKQLLCIMY